MMNFQKVVVVKLIHPHLSSEKQFIDMFLDEARYSALIKHHNVDDIYELGRAENTYYIAMEHIHGQPLSKVISRSAKGKRLDVLTTARLIADALGGLSAAHNLTSIAGEPVELVHRDVSPGNILVSYAGAVKLVDFGVSQSIAQLNTTDNLQLKGKIGYASPEQLEEAPHDHRTDIFSLGVVLWEALALTRLYRAESAAATVRRILAGNPKPPSELRPDVPARLDEITLRALALKREDRYQSAEEMRDDLLEFLRGAKYFGDERQLAAHMEAEFHDERLEAEALLRAVATAEEEIEVDLEILEELDSPWLIEDEDDLEPELEIVPTVESLAEGAGAESTSSSSLAEGSEARPASSLSLVASEPAAAAKAVSGDSVVAVELDNVSVKKGRWSVIAAMAVAAVVLLGIVALILGGGDDDNDNDNDDGGRSSGAETAPKEAPEPTPPPPPVAPPPPVDADMIGVPAAPTGQLIGRQALGGSRAARLPRGARACPCW